MGSVRCESATTAPWPGKCLAVAAMPASRIPCIQAVASWATASAAGWKARSPIASLTP
jgi:hypothetical protein